MLRVVKRSEIKPEAFAIDSRWVFTIKDAPDGSDRKILKARLVARGFQETHLHKLEVESPTAKRWSVRLVCSFAMVWDYDVLCMDIKTTFLQSDVPVALQDGYQVFIGPPKYTDLKPDEIFLRTANKSLYGERRAPRRWYETLHRALMAAGYTQEPTDTCLYFKKTPNGVVTLHVDDLIATGDSKMLKELESLDFKVGKSQRNKFKYVGPRIEKFGDALTISQAEYYENIKPLDIHRKLHRDRMDTPLTKQEESAVRSSLGMLLWLAISTRPDILYSAIEVAKCATTEKAVWIINKIVRELVKSGPIAVAYR